MLGFKLNRVAIMGFLMGIFTDIAISKHSVNTPFRVTPPPPLCMTRNSLFMHFEK